MTDRVEYFFLIVLAEQLMDVWELIGDWLLKDSKGNADSLEILGTSDHMNIDGF